MSTIFTIPSLSGRTWRMVPDIQPHPMVWVQPCDRYTGAVAVDATRFQLHRKHLVPFTTGARTSDPVTAHAAADSITIDRRRNVHRHVLHVLDIHGPCTDFDLARLVSPLIGYPIKQTSVGVRRKELVRLGLVADSGTRGTSDTGTTAIRWCLTQSGRRELAA